MLLERVGLQHVPPDPVVEDVTVATELIPSLIERVVAVAVAVGVRRMRSAWDDTHGRNNPRREDDRSARVERANPLFDRHDRSARRENGLLLHALNTPETDVAFGIDLLRVNDGNVWSQRRDGRQLLARERAGDRRDAGSASREVRSAVTAKRSER